jgi:pyruvate-formate lyase-activating enzyme
LNLALSEPYPKALIRLGVACNNACFFCHKRTDGAGFADLDTDAVMARIRVAASAGAAMVVFSGGEPTIRKDIIALCEYAREIGLESGLITNGRMFYYRSFTERLAAVGVKYVLISILGADAATHNQIVGQDAFLQTQKGLENIARLPVRIVVNTVLTKLNANAPILIAKILEGVAPVHYKISLPEPKGSILSNRDTVFPPKEAAAHARLIAQALSKTSGITFGFDGFTPCLLDNFFLLNDDFHTHGFRMVSEPGETRFYPPDNGDRAFLPACGICSVRHVCPGIYSKYLEWFPETSLPPIVKPVSNSIRFSLLSRHKLKPGEEACRSIPMPQPMPARRAAVKAGSELLLYKTDEIETDTEELRRMKLESVYRFNPARPDDYPGNLKKMRLSRKCAGCTRSVCCPGLFVPSGERPYADAAAREVGLLRLAKGRTLEIGGGGTFFKRFKQLLLDKQISLYVGIDPQPRSDPPIGDEKGFVFIKTALEKFQWREKPFDTVFLFRSWRHLKDIEECMAVICSVTKRGSLIVITEDCRHIELYDDPKGASGADGKQIFEHYRNHTPEQASNVLERFGFDPVKISPAEKNTANHWTLTAKRKR